MDEIILGTWYDKSQEITWEMLKLDEDTYGLILTEDSVPALFHVHLLELAGYYFLDFYPEEFDIPHETGSNLFDLNMDMYGCVNTVLSMHLLPVHTFARLDIHDDHLEIRRFDMEWLSNLFEENKIRIAHERTEDNILLTASTNELQAFVSKYADDDEAFVEREYLERVE
jgi:hypothetical protein